jgi:cytochrome c-type biogenesis protein CcmH/NrfG
MHGLGPAQQWSLDLAEDLRAYAMALDVLGRNRRALDALAAALFAAGYLDRAEIDAALAQTPLLKQTLFELRYPKPPEACEH